MKTASSSRKRREPEQMPGEYRNERPIIGLFDEPEGESPETWICNFIVILVFGGLFAVAVSILIYNS